MALFGKSDAGGVPLLTAFYQAEADPKTLIGGEIDVLLYRYLCREPHSLCLWSDTRSEAREMVERALHLLGSKHRLLVRVMDAAADKKTLATIQHDVSTLNGLIAQFLTPPQMLWVLDINNTGYFDVWYAKNLAQKGETPHDDTMRFLSWVLSDFVKAAERQAFTKCVECKSAFAASRAGVKYCSRRCSARVGERQRRTTKEETLHIAIK